MGKRVSLPTVSLGSDARVPEHTHLAGWVAKRRGQAGDLISYHLENGLLPQLEAEVTTPCAGGTFYQDRWISSMTGIEGTVITGEIGSDTGQLIHDADILSAMRKDLWCAIPATRTLGLIDTYYHDPEEAAHSLFSTYREMMRAMRDNGIAGHVILCENPEKEELETLAGRKVFFFCNRETKKSLALLLEYQAVVAIRSSSLGLIENLMGEYDVQKIILLDPAEEDLKQAIELKDADNLLCGGYCHDTCDQYWKSLVRNAGFFR